MPKERVKNSTAEMEGGLKTQASKIILFLGWKDEIHTAREANIVNAGCRTYIVYIVNAGCRIYIIYI